MSLIKCGRETSSFVTARGETYAVTDVPSLLRLMTSLKLRTEVVRRACRHYIKMQQDIPGAPKRRRGRPSISDLQSLYPEIAITIRTSHSSLDKSLTTTEAKKAYWERGRTCEACLENPSSTGWRVYGYARYPQHKDSAENLLFLCRSCCQTLTNRVQRGISTFSGIIGFLMRFGASQEYLERQFKRLIDLEEPAYWTAKSGHLRSLKASGKLNKFYPDAPVGRTAMNTEFFREDPAEETPFEATETVMVGGESEQEEN